MDAISALQHIPQTDCVVYRKWSSSLTRFVRQSVGLSIGWLVCRLVDRNFLKGRKFHFHAPIGELVNFKGRINAIELLKTTGWGKTISFYNFRIFKSDVCVIIIYIINTKLENNYFLIKSKGRNRYRCSLSLTISR